MGARPFLVGFAVALGACSPFGAGSSQTTEDAGVPDAPAPDAASDAAPSDASGGGGILRGATQQIADGPEVTVALPAGTRPGDLLWLVVQTHYDNNLELVGSGWTSLKRDFDDACGLHGTLFELAYHVATANEPATYTMRSTNGSTTWFAALLAFQVTAPVAPPASTYGHVPHNPYALPAPAVLAPSLLVATYAFGFDDNATWSTPDGSMPVFSAGPLAIFARYVDVTSLPLAPVDAKPDGCGKIHVAVVPR